MSLCNKKYTFLLHSSFMKKLDNSLTCLPIFYKSIMKLSKNDSLPICINERFHPTHGLTSSAIKSCPKSCKMTSFSGNIQAFPGFSLQMYFNLTNFNYTSYIWFGTSYRSFDIEINKEYLIYNTEDAIGAIGGTVGLFTGFSVLNLFIFIVSISKEILSRFTFFERNGEEV